MALSLPVSHTLQVIQRAHLPQPGAQSYRDVVRDSVSRWEICLGINRIRIGIGYGDQVFGVFSGGRMHGL